jgi:cytochrome bd-type quinol oxidase subunit 2
MNNKTTKTKPRQNITQSLTNNEPNSDKRAKALLAISIMLSLVYTVTYILLGVTASVIKNDTSKLGSTAIVASLPTLIFSSIVMIGINQMLPKTKTKIPWTIVAFIVTTAIFATVLVLAD